MMLIQLGQLLREIRYCLPTSSIRRAYDAISTHQRQHTHTFTFKGHVGDHRGHRIEHRAQNGEIEHGEGEERDRENRRNVKKYQQ